MATSKKVMDVAKPEDSTPDIGSKPMIVGHKSLPIDPMVKSTEKTDSDGTEVADTPISEKLSSPSEKQKVITPPSEEGKASIESVDEASSDNSSPDSIKEDSSSSEKTSDTMQKDVPKKEDVAPKDDSVTKKDTVSEQPADENSTESAEAEKKIDPVALEMEKQDEIRKLIDSKQYNVSVKQARRNNPTRLVVIFVLLLLVGLLAVVYLIDTGKLDIGVKLPFQLFSRHEDSSELNSSTPVEEKPVTMTENPTDSEDAKVTDPTLFSIEAFDFSMSRNEKWAYEDKSRIVDGTPFILAFAINAGDYSVNASTVTGKGGICEPAASDTPHAMSNQCPTAEVVKITETDGGWLQLIKYTDPDSQEKDGVTTYNYCFRPDTTLAGEALQKPELNKPEMGFVMQCGPEEIYMNIYETSKTSEAENIVSSHTDESFYDAAGVQTLLDNLSTIRFNQNRN